MRGKPFLNRRLVLESPVPEPDGAGGFTLGWQETGVMWGVITLHGGAESRSGGRERPVVGGTIVVRNARLGSPQRPRHDQRLRAGTRVFDILSVTDLDQERRFLICHVREGQP